MAGEVAIRPEGPADRPAIHDLTRRAFEAAPHSSHTEQFIVDALRRAGALRLSLVAAAGSDLVGHVAFSPVTIADGTPGWLGLGPVSVQPDRQGRGIGSALIRAALARLAADGAAGCVVLGEPAYYARFGFRAETGLALPGVPAEYFQALVFTPPLPRGTVAYHPAFAATE